MAAMAWLSKSRRAIAPPAIRQAPACSAPTVFRCGFRRESACFGSPFFRRFVASSTRSSMLGSDAVSCSSMADSSCSLPWDCFSTSFSTSCCATTTSAALWSSSSVSVASSSWSWCTASCSKSSGFSIPAFSAISATTSMSTSCVTATDGCMDSMATLMPLSLHRAWSSTKAGCPGKKFSARSAMSYAPSRSPIRSNKMAMFAVAGACSSLRSRQIWKD